MLFLIMQFVNFQKAIHTNRANLKTHECHSKGNDEKSDLYLYSDNTIPIKRKHQDNNRESTKIKRSKVESKLNTNLSFRKNISNMKFTDNHIYDLNEKINKNYSESKKEQDKGLIRKIKFNITDPLTRRKSFLSSYETIRSFAKIIDPSEVLNFEMRNQIIYGSEESVGESYKNNVVANIKSADDISENFTIKETSNKKFELILTYDHFANIDSMSYNYTKKEKFHYMEIIYFNLILEKILFYDEKYNVLKNNSGMNEFTNSILGIVQFENVASNQTDETYCNNDNQAKHSIKTHQEIINSQEKTYAEILAIFIASRNNFRRIIDECIKILDKKCKVSKINFLYQVNIYSMIAFASSYQHNVNIIQNITEEFLTKKHFKSLVDKFNLDFEKKFYTVLYLLEKKEIYNILYPHKNEEKEKTDYNKFIPPNLNTNINEKIKNFSNYKNSAIELNKQKHIIHKDFNNKIVIFKKIKNKNNQKCEKYVLELLNIHHIHSLMTLNHIAYRILTFNNDFVCNKVNLNRDGKIIYDKFYKTHIKNVKMYQNTMKLKRK